MKKDRMVGADYTQEEILTLSELIESCHVTPEYINELVAIGVLHPSQQGFTLLHLQRVKKARRLQRDLEINLAGVAMVLDLLDEMEKMRAKVEFLEKHILSGE